MVLTYSNVLTLDAKARAEIGSRLEHRIGVAGVRNCWLNCERQLLILRVSERCRMAVGVVVGAGCQDVVHGWRAGVASDR
jgi:hypothetical protein